MENNTVLIHTLRFKKDFLKIKFQGKRVYNDFLLGNFYFDPKRLNKESGQSFYFGLTLSRKVGNAVTRNRLKRYSREIIKNNPIPGVSLNLIVLPQKGNKKFFKDEVDYERFKTTLMELLNKIKKRI